MGVERFERRVEELLGDAREAAARRDWQAVRALAQSILALDPANEPAARLLADSRSAADENGEWRHLTVMFCDLVGSTTLAVEHDPEAVRDILRAYQDAASRVVGRYEGHVARYIGDGVLAYFGYPIPHEDDPRRAAKAGLDLLAVMRDLAREVRERHDFELAVRVAVHTGMVIRADMGPPTSPDRDAVVGETPNLAARLQDHAQPGTLVISEDTHRLVRGFFEVKPLGSIELRGVPQAIEAYEVVGESPTAGKLEAQHELSPFVDRYEELGRLTALWRKVMEGGSHVAAIRGEPGIGKSRLMDTVRAMVASEQGSPLSFRCSTFHATTHLYPARRLVAELCGVDLAGDLAGAAPRLRRLLRDAALEHHVPLFGALLGIPPSSECPAPELDGQRLREATLDALVEWIETEATMSARALMVDDLQWADPSTIELLDRLIARRIPRTLVLLSARSGPDLPWASVEVLDLGPLAPADLEGIAAASPAGQRLTASQVEQLVRRSDGVPLFFEELLRVEDQPGQSPPPRLMSRRTAIPPSLLDPLLARLAAPGVELGLIQTVACMGHEVNQDLLTEVVDLTEDELQVRLDGLVEARLLERAPGTPAIYRFHHHLLRELAYDTQLTPARLQRHARIADALRRQAPADGPVDAGRLAQHLEQAGKADEAIEAYVDAARGALSQGALAEASQILDHALELVAGIADRQVRWTLELAVRRARGFAMVATQGYGAPEAAREHERCLELCKMMEPGPEHLPDLIAVWSYYMSVGALGRAEQVMSVDWHGTEDGLDAPPLELFAGWNLYYGRGEVAPAIAKLKAYLDSQYAQREEMPLPRWPLPNDPTVATWGLLSTLEYIRGNPAAAEEAIRNAEARAAKLPFPWGPFSMAWANAYRCILGRLANDEDVVDQSIARMLELGERHGFMYWTVFGELHRAIAALRRQVASEPEPVIQQLAMWRIVGGDLMMPWHLTEFAAAQLACEDLEGCVRSLREATAISDRTRERYWAAETARLLGQVRLAGDRAGVEALREASEIAARQGARLLELRARTALCSVLAEREELDRLAALLETFGDAPGPPELDAARQTLSGQPH